MNQNLAYLSTAVAVNWLQQAGLSGMSMTGGYAGTPVFMPREQITNFKYVKPVAAMLHTSETGFTYHEGPRSIDVILNDDIVPIRRRERTLPKTSAPSWTRPSNEKPGIATKRRLKCSPLRWLDRRPDAEHMLSMKMIASREFSARPAAVWSGLAEDGAVVVTRDGTPIGIITPTSPETLLEDMQEIVFAKARHAARALREAAVENGTAEMTMEQIDEEIRLARKSRKR